MGKIIRKISLRQPLTKVIVSEVKIINDKLRIGKTSTPCNALIDTGATASVISSRIIKLLNLEPIGKTKVHTASHGNQDAYVYQIVIGISLDEKAELFPNGGIKITADNWLPMPVHVTNSESISEQNFDVLLGMDVIMQGHLSVSDGVFIFSI